MIISGFTITPKAISIVIDGRMRLVDASAPTYSDIKHILLRGAHLRTDEQGDLARAQLADTLDVRRRVVRYSSGRLQVFDDEVMFDGKLVSGVIVERLLEQMSAGYEFTPLALFLDNLMTNPSETARNELYLWLESSNLPITNDGHFLAWKKVRDDYTSYYDGRTDNSIGAVLMMMRGDVNVDRDATCAAGYHFCSYSYLHSYYGDQGRVVVCKINPADVVAIPRDYNNAKGRACRYTIIAEVPEDEAAQFFHKPVVSADVGKIDQFDPREWDDEDDNTNDDEDNTDEVRSWLTDDYDDDDDEALETHPVPAGPAPKLLKDYQSYGNLNAPDLYNAFDWIHTSQGHTFWSRRYRTGLDVMASNILLAWDTQVVKEQAAHAALLPGAPPSRLCVSFTKKFGELRGDELIIAFTWTETVQGGDFWLHRYSKGIDATARAILLSWDEQNAAAAKDFEMKDPVWVQKDVTADYLPGGNHSTPAVAVATISYPGKAALRAALRRYSQRQIAKDYGIPRTTLQDLIARYWPDKAKRPTK